PPNLPPADTELVLVQSELYLAAPDGTADEAALVAERPTAVVFNGYADQYVHAPIEVRVGERVRIWLVDAGPQRSTSFHVVGGQGVVAGERGGRGLLVAVPWPGGPWCGSCTWWGP